MAALAALLIPAPAANAQGADFPIATSTGEELSISAGFDGTNYLVGIQGDATAPDAITAQLVSQAGALVGPRLSLGRTGVMPGVAFGGSQYLMVWEDNAGGAVTRLYGAFVSPAGALVGSPFAFPVASGALPRQTLQGMAFDGTRFLVIYGDNSGPDSTPYNLCARFVSTTGVVGSQINLANNARGTLQAVAWNGTTYGVAWPAHIGGNQNIIQGCTISPAGVVSGVITIDPEVSLDQNPLSVASDGTNFLVVWNYDESVDAEGDAIWELRGRIVTPDGGFLGSPFIIADTTNRPRFPGVAFDGTNYLVAWTARDESGGSDIVGRRFTPAGVALDSAFAIADAGFAGLPFVVPGGEQTLVGWNDGFALGATGPVGDDVRGTLFSTNHLLTAGNWSTGPASGNGVTAFANGRLDFTVAAGTSDDLSGRIWAISEAPYTSDWSVQVDVHLALLSLADAQFANLNLAVVNSASLAGATETWDLMDVAIDRFGDAGTVRGFESSLSAYYDGTAHRSAANMEHEQPSESTDGTLRISFNAATKALSTAYDADGAAGGASWTTLQTIDIGSGVYTWNMAAGSTFKIVLVGSSGSSDGQDNGPVLGAGQAYFHDFSVAGLVENAAPAFTTQPSAQTVALGQTATFTVAADGVPAPAWRWQQSTNGGGTWANLDDGGTQPAYSGTRTATLTIAGTTLAMNGHQFRCVASNGIAPDATSAAATLTVTKTAATVTLSGLSHLYDGTAKAATVATVPAGLDVVVTYAGSAQAPSAIGTYEVVATVDDATYAGSATGLLVIAPVAASVSAPVVVAGGEIVLSSALSTGTTATGYQWQVRRTSGGTAFRVGDLWAAVDEWIDLPGATEATLTLACAQQFDGAEYRVVAMIGGEPVASGPVAIEVEAAPPSQSRLLNLSTRALCRTGDDVLIPGFVIDGSGTKHLLIRAVGPTLGAAPFSLGGTLPNPQFTLKRMVDGSYQDIAHNDDWGTNDNAAAIRAAAARVWAFALTEDSGDAALLVDLPVGQYTVVASDVDPATTGLAIVEFYDADETPGAASLVNLSNRGYVGVGDQIMIPGVIISDESSKTLLIRAIGPGLAQFGVGGLLADPQVTIYRSSERLLTNDDWGVGADAAATSAVGARVFAFPLAAGSKDAAFVVTLPAGAYTVQASGVGESTGVVLVEVYQVPDLR